jgi:hypothetical protein
MRCEQFETRLNDVLDLRGDPRRDRPLAAHAAVCGDCRRLLGSYEAMLGGLAEIESFAEASSLDSTPAFSFGSRSVLAAAAAVVLLALLVRQPASEHASSPAVENGIAAMPTAAIVAEEKSTPPAGSPVVVDYARRTGRAYVELAHGTARGFDEAIALATAIPPPDELLPPAIFSDDGLLKRLEVDLVPAAGETFDKLRNVFETEPTGRS